VTEPGKGRPSRISKWASTARRYQEKLRSHQERLEKRPWVAFPLESVRRFNKIEGKHLAIVIALNLFIAVIPLIIIGYAFIEAVCTVAAVAVHAVLAFFLRNWFSQYGHAYGGFGVSLALAAAVGVIASFWVWIAAVMGVYWERKAGPAAVAEMEQLSAKEGAA